METTGEQLDPFVSDSDSFFLATDVIGGETCGGIKERLRSLPLFEQPPFDVGESI
jgi:hypothetical protein